MQDTRELIDRLNLGTKPLSKGHRRIAEYIAQHYDKAVFMTAGALGRECGVSESTVVRFAIALGYDGYPALQKALQEMIRGKLTGVKTLPVRPCVSRELGMGLHPREQLPPDISRLRECVLEYIGEL